MNRPKWLFATDLCEGRPYIGEYYQPDDKVYMKVEADKYFTYLEEKIRALEERNKRSRANDYT